MIASRTVAVLLASILMMPVSGHAQEVCSDGNCWPAGSAMATGIDAVNHRIQTEKALQRLHAELVQLMSPYSDERLLQALKTQESAWLTYRREECELIGSLTGAGGSWPSTYAVRCESNFTDDRLRRVKSATRCVKRIPEDQRSIESSTCLQQLAPLVNR
jgi:uncharacterized protein YecT (DUF1311 family)